MINRILWITALLILLPACGGFKSTAYVTEDSGPKGPYFENGESALVPSTDSLEKNCKQIRRFDTCLFQKNPTAQEGAPVVSADLESARKFGVKIRDLGTSGFLENKNLQVLTLNTPRFTLQQKTLLKAPFSEIRSYVEQLSSYYWANRVFKFLEPRMGAARVGLKDIKIYADDVFTGFSASNNSIHLQKSPDRVPAALSADLVIHLMGEALASHISGQKLFSGDRSVQHKTCDLNPNGCCATYAGCSQALAVSFGDYVVGMMNPTKPRVGESVLGSMNGQMICGLARDLGTLAPTQSQAQIYGTCTAAPGRVSLMGSWYASLWWNLRLKHETRDIDLLFFDHAKEWTGTATFLDAKTSALNLAKTYKGGRYLAAFDAAFAAIAP